MAKKIVITSGKGGVGKTTVTANLGINLAKLGKKVAVFDVDFGLNNLDVVLGLEKNVLYDLSDVLDGRCRLKQALLQHSFYKNLYVLPSDKINSFSSLTGQNVKLLLDGFSSSFDYVLIDCPAGIDVGFHRAISCADEVLLVVTTDSSSIRDASKAFSIVKSYKPDYVGLIVNRARGDLIAGNKVMKPLEIAHALRVELFGVIPDDDAVIFINERGLNKRSNASKAYKILAENLVYGKRNLYDSTERYSGFFGSIRRGIKSNI
jgi:septum site-determining protein MinD